MTQPIDPSLLDTAVPAPVPAASATDASVNQLAGTIQTMIDTAMAGAQKAVKGVITAVSLGGSPPTVSLTLSGDTTVITTVRFIDSYSPVVGDTVLVEKQGSDIFVLGQMNDSSSGTANGWTAFPTLGSGFTTNGNSNGPAEYRTAVNNGDNTIQVRGSLAISGTPTAICTLPSGAHPTSAARTISVAASGGQTANVTFNTDGTVVLTTSSGTSGSTTPAATGSVAAHNHGIFTSLDGYLSNAGSNLIHSHIGNDGTDGGGGGTDVANSHTHTSAAHTHTLSSAPTYITFNGVGDIYL